MRKIIAIISLIGTVLFGSLFILSYVNPTYVESIARDVIRMEVERRVGERLTNLEGTRIAEMAARISGKNKAEIADIKRQVAEGVPAKVARIAAQMRNASCECRKSIEKSMGGVFEKRIIELTRINERLELLIRTKYMEVAESLIREFRIFSGANALVFMLLGLTVIARKRATLQLIPPTLVLLGAAGIVGYLYLFNQNWMHSILFGDYVGLAYFIYLGVAVAFLADIGFNRARITTTILNAMLQSVGSAVQAVPC